ncbi:MAG: polysaccharide deacetylase family protein [Desulfohalobiaceae bacterium]
MKNQQAHILLYGLALAAFLLAGALMLIRPELAAIPLAGFILVCLLAPFFPAAGLLLPVIRRGERNSKQVALTFDDGPHPYTTPSLLQLLAQHRIHATFFVLGHNAQTHPELIQAILEAGHDLGNHTYSHDPLIMLKAAKRLAQEIDAAQSEIASHGVQPLAFRPPAGIVNPKLGPLLQARGMLCVHYSCKAYDLGNRRIQGLAGRILNKVQAGDIVLLHDIAPQSSHFRHEQWLAEIEELLQGLSQKGLQVRPLQELIQRPVLLRTH